MRADPRQGRAKREAALGRPELREGHGFVLVSARLPEEGRHLTVWANDGNGNYRLPFPVVFNNGRWHNAGCDRQLEVVIIGWNYR